MDEETSKTIAGLERNSRFPTGIGKVERSECAIGALSPIGCTFCSYGHMLECHYPFTCEEVKCSHYQREMEADKPCGDSMHLPVSIRVLVWTK